METLKLNPLTRRVVKPLIKLITTINLLGISFLPSNAQNKPQDTTAFKRDFEKLLSKYGINSKGYFINITSVNQSGGQTAFIISNNYYGDTLLDANNFVYKISDAGNINVMEVYPKKGVWVSPFVVTDSASANKDFFKPGIGVSTFLHGIEGNINNKTYTLAGYGRSAGCSKRFPVYIYFNKKDDSQFFIFGDLQVPSKSYLYYKGKVSWFPGPED